MNTYEQDPYAVFIVSPERALAETIRARLRSDGTFGRVIEPGSGLTPSVIVEATVNELDGDFRQPSKPIAEMAIHFIVYNDGPDGPGHVVLDKICAGRTPLKGRTPAALMAGWDEDLREIMDEVNAEQAKTHLDDRQ